MKKTLTILILLALSLSSCNWSYRDDEDAYNSRANLTDLLQSYNLWYVDIDRATGPGNVSFMSKAFTMSFMPDYEVFANDNMVGLGQTGNGFGIRIGTYQVYNRNGILSIVDDLAGQYDFEVRQLNQNEISLYNRAEDVTYILVGYQKSNFDYDKLFYNNVTYFLQEYQAWSKVFADVVSPSEPFVLENHLTFYVDGNTNVFESSESDPNLPLASIYWDYTGTYEVLNTSYQDEKDLVLYYDLNNSREKFALSIIDDQTIELHNLVTDNIYRFEGRGYIQYRPKAKRIKRNLLSKTNTKYMKL